MTNCIYTPSQFRSTLLHFVLLSCVGGLSSSVYAACDVKFGDDLYDWVTQDAHRQSSELANPDFISRTRHGRVIEYDELSKKVATASEVLDGFGKEVSDMQSHIGAYPDPATAIKMQRVATKALDTLLHQRDELNSVKQRLSILSSQPSLEQFREDDGLHNVGRATLLKSIMDVGNQSAQTLNTRYAFGVNVTFDTNGNVSGGHANISGNSNTQKADYAATLLLNSGDPYCQAVGGAYYAIRFLVFGIQEVECQNRIDSQKKRALDASRLLEQTLLSERELFNIYSAELLQEQKDFAPVHAEFNKIVEVLDGRLRSHISLDLALLNVSSKILTADTVDALKQDYNNGNLSADVFREVALIQMRDQVKLVKENNLQRELSVSRACRNSDGVRAAEDLLDARDEAVAQLIQLQHMDEFAPAHSTLLKIQKRLEKRVPHAETLFNTGQGLECSQAQKDAFLGALKLRASIKKVGEASQFVRHKGRGLSTKTKAKPIASILKPKAINIDGMSFCSIMRRDGAVYACDIPNGSGTYLGTEFPAGAGTPYERIITGANDGGFSTDVRRIETEISAARANISARISYLRERELAISAAIPAWKISMSTGVAALTNRSTQTANIETTSRESIFLKNRPILAETENRLTKFARGTSDPTILTDLMRESGAVDTTLPELPLDRVMPDGPSILGFGQRDNAYPRGATLGERKILRESRKGSALAGANARSTHSALLSLARKFSASTMPTGQIVADALLEDAASLRYRERGILAQSSATTISKSGVVGRLPYWGRTLPQDSLLTIGEGFNTGLSIVQQQQTLARTALTPGAADIDARTKLLQDSEGLSQDAESEFYGGNPRSGQTLLNQAADNVLAALNGRDNLHEQLWVTPHNVIDLRTKTDVDGNEREISFCARPSLDTPKNLPGHAFVAFSSELPLPNGRHYLALGHTLEAGTTLLSGLLSRWLPVKGEILPESYTSTLEQCLVVRVNKDSFDQAVERTTTMIGELLLLPDPLSLEGNHLESYSLGRDDCMSMMIKVAKVLEKTSNSAGLIIPPRGAVELPMDYLRRFIDSN